MKNYIEVNRLSASKAVEKHAERVSATVHELTTEKLFDFAAHNLRLNIHDTLWKDSESETFY